MVAVKTLLKSEVPEAKNWTSVFLQEVAMLKRLNHPNIVSFIESFSTPAEYVIVNQYLSGGQLFGRLGELTVYNEQVASRLAKQMFQALHFCHKNNIVHRDLKPANFVFSSTQPDAGLFFLICLSSIFNCNSDVVLMFCLQC
jgi:serine/threonine protein kinase